jgi:hypothetical protein
MARTHRVALAAVLVVGGASWLASAATASPAVKHDTVAVVGSGISTVEVLDEHGNVNQTTVNPTGS